MARWDDKSAKCPFFKTNESRTIICEGVADGTRLCLAFKKGDDKAEYKDRYCDQIANYTNCRVAKMLTEKYDTQTKNKR